MLEEQGKSHTSSSRTVSRITELINEMNRQEFIETKSREQKEELRISEQNLMIQLKKNEDLSFSLMTMINKFHEQDKRVQVHKEDIDNLTEMISYIATQELIETKSNEQMEITRIIN
jgi:hypothetical protein